MSSFEAPETISGSVFVSYSYRFRSKNDALITAQEHGVAYIGVVTTILITTKSKALTTKNNRINTKNNYCRIYEVMRNNVDLTNGSTILWVLHPYHSLGKCVCDNSHKKTISTFSISNFKISKFTVSKFISQSLQYKSFEYQSVE